jgi:hypothetical protein
MRRCAKAEIRPSDASLSAQSLPRIARGNCGREAVEKPPSELCIKCLREDELSGSEMRRVEIEGDDGNKVGVLLSRMGEVRSALSPPPALTGRRL